MRPRWRRAAIRPAVTVVLPTLEEAPAMTMRGISNAGFNATSQPCGRYDRVPPSKLNTRLRPNLLVLQRMLDKLHFRDEISAFDDLVRSIASGEDDMGESRPALDTREHLLDGQVVLAQRDVHLIEQYQLECRIRQIAGCHLPARLR